MSDSTVRKKGDYLAEIAAALPQPLKDAIRSDLAGDPHIAFLDDDRNFAKLWDGLSGADKQHFFALAGIPDQTAAQIEKDIGTIYANAAKTPRSAFNNEAASAEEDAILNGDMNPDETVVTGRVDPDETEEEIKARRKKFETVMRELYEEDEKEKAAQKQSASQDKNKQNPDAAGSDNEKENRYKLGGMSWRYGITDHGDDHMSLKGKGRKMPGGRRMVDENQLRAVILKAVLEKGWTELQFLRNGKPDSQLISQVKSMLDNDPGIHKALGNKAGKIRVLTSLEEAPPPHVTGSIGKWLHQRRYNAQVAQNERDTRTAVKKAIKMARNVRGEDGKTLADEIKTRRDEARRDGKPWARRWHEKGIVGAVTTTAKTGGAMLGQVFSKSAQGQEPPVTEPVAEGNEKAAPQAAPPPATEDPLHNATGGGPQQPPHA